MKTAHLIAMACLAVLAAGCNRTGAVECSSVDGQAVITSLMSDQILQATRDQLGASAPQPPVNESQVRAALSKIKMTIEDIRTTKKDQGSTRRTCAATVKLVLPLNMIADAERFHTANQLEPISTLTGAAGLRRSADSFTHELAYSVQPTDDKKKVYGEIEGFGPVASALGTLIAAHLVLPALEASQQSEAATAQAQQALLDQQTLAQNQADLELATAENKLAVQAYSEVWKSLPDETRAQNIGIQRAWAKKKTANCNIRAAETSIDPLVREAARLRCETEQTQARTGEMKGLIE